MYQMMMGNANHLSVAKMECIKNKFTLAPHQI